jgi:hypothetical protein
MNALRVVACAALLGAAVAQAQQAPPPQATARAASSEACISVEVEGQSGGYLDCLNQELARFIEAQGGRQAALQTQVDQANPLAPTQQGLYNQAATRERLLGNFGVSARPPPPPPPSPPPLLHPH